MLTEKEASMDMNENNHKLSSKSRCFFWKIFRYHIAHHIRAISYSTSMTLTELRRGEIQKCFTEVEHRSDTLLAAVLI